MTEWWEKLKPWELPTDFQLGPGAEPSYAPTMPRQQAAGQTSMPRWMQLKPPVPQTGTQVPQTGTPQEVELEGGFRVTPDNQVYFKDYPVPIGKINQETGAFEEREKSWWEKAGAVLKWLPPNIGGTLIQQYGLPAAHKVDIPFMIQAKARELDEKVKGGFELNEADQKFFDQYKQEVGSPPSHHTLMKILLPGPEAIRQWATTKLKPSEDLKASYYDSTGIGSRMLHGVTTPLSVAVMTAGALGGATALQPHLAKQAAKPGIAGAIGKAGQMMTAPMVGYEAISRAVVSKTIGGTYRAVMTASLKRNLRSWAATSGIEIPRETEKAFITWAVNNWKPSFMIKESLKHLFKPVKGGYTVTQAGATAANQAAQEAVRIAPMLTSLTKTTPTAVAPTGMPTVPTTMTGLTTAQAMTPWETVTPGAVPTTAMADWGDMEGLQEFLSTDPLATYTVHIGNRKVHLDYFLKHGDWPESFTVKEAAALMMKPESQVMSKIKKGGIETNRVESAYVLDEISEQFGLTDEQFIQRLRAIRDAKKALQRMETYGEEDYYMPEAAEGQLEAGLQLDMEGKTTLVQPPSKGKPVTASMEDYAKLQAMKAEVTPTAPAVEPTATPQEGVPKVTPTTSQGLEARRAEIKDLLAEPAKNLPQGVTKVALRKELAGIDKKLVPDEKKLRQDIMATVKNKHIPESQSRKIFRESGGARHLTDMGYGQLNKVLAAVKRARPVKIHGQTVVTQKTEQAVQSLKDILVAEKKLTPEIYDGLKQYLKLPTDRFESVDRFISERQARELIRLMNFEAEVGLTGWDVKVGEGLVNNPPLKTAIDKLGTRIAQENAGKPPAGVPLSEVAKEVSPYPDDVGLSGWMSALRALRRFQEQLGGRAATRIYETAEMMIEARRLNDVALAQRVSNMKAEVPQVVTVTQNEKSMARIQQWLDSDLKGVDIKKPDLTPDELAVAKLFRREYDQWKDVVRLERFKDAYYHHGNNPELIKHGTEGTSDVAIPDAPLADIKEAIRIYESQGETALREFLNKKDWGVIESGYSFSHVLHPKLRLARQMATRATTTSLHQRKGLEFLRDERTPWERLVSYERQMIGLNLQPYFRKMDMEFKKAVATGRMSEASVRDAANKISLLLREVKGYPVESPVAAFLLRVGGWAFGSLAKVPWMSLRNLHQNIAFGADKSELIRAIVPGQGFFSDPLTKAGRLAYTDALVHQYKGVQQEQLLSGYMGKTPLERLIRKTDYYHLSDKANRHIAMNAYGAKAERALNAYLKDGDVAKFLRNSGANELSATEQARILEYLALDKYDYGGTLGTVSGGEAAIREIASKRTTLDHFNYVRYLRSIHEMGETGRLAGSLMAFPRSVGEKYVDQFSRIKRLGGAERRRAIHSLLALVIGSYIAGQMIEKETGKTRDPYNPLLIFQWQVGGLAIGATQDLMELYRLITNLSFAEDERSQQYTMNELTKLIPRLGSMFIPWYQPTINLLQAATDSRYIDRKWLRQLREVFDENYELNEEFYKIERDWLERIQHGLFGTATPDPSDMEQALKKVQGIADPLGQADEEGEIYTTSKLGSDINSAIRNLDASELIEENGFSPLVLAYADYQAMRDDYFEVDADKRYDYRKDNPEVDANLFFWSYVTTLQSDTAKELVLQMIDRFGIPPESIRGYEKAFAVQETPTQETSDRWSGLAPTTGGGLAPSTSAPPGQERWRALKPGG